MAVLGFQAGHGRGAGAPHGETQGRMGGFWGLGLTACCWGRGQRQLQTPPAGRLSFQEAAPRTPARRVQRSWNSPQGLNWGLSLEPVRKEVNIIK